MIHTVLYTLYRYSYSMGNFLKYPVQYNCFQIEFAGWVLEKKTQRHFSLIIMMTRLVLNILYRFCPVFCKGGHALFSLCAI